MTNSTGGTVYIVPAPIAPPAVHMGTSTSPATAQSNSTLISDLDEMPAVTRFGQADVFNGRRMFIDQFEVAPESSSLIDYIVPYRAVAPAAAPVGQPAPQTPARNAQCRPLAIPQSIRHSN